MKWTREAADAYSAQIASAAPAPLAAPPSALGQGLEPGPASLAFLGAQRTGGPECAAPGDQPRPRRRPPGLGSQHLPSHTAPLPSQSRGYHDGPFRPALVAATLFSAALCISELRPPAWLSWPQCVLRGLGTSFKGTVGSSLGQWLQGGRWSNVLPLPAPRAGRCQCCEWPWVKKLGQRTFGRSRALKLLLQPDLNGL